MQMKNLQTNKLKYAQILVLSSVFVLLCFLLWTGFGITASAQPGSPEDPLVSRSYVDARIAQLEAQIAALSLAQEAPALPPPAIYSPAGARELFHVVRAEPGMVLIGHGSTEIILRAGEASVVAGPYNGIANVTLGHDLMNGQAVPLNHLLIVPQHDGRGLRFYATAYLMIKGDFHFVYE